MKTNQDPLADLILHHGDAAVLRPDGAGAVGTGGAVGIVAHPDDLEIAAFHGILAGRSEDHPGFVGIVVTHGGGSPRGGAYAETSDDAMRETRRHEQFAAAVRGGYRAIVFLNYDSAALKGGGRSRVEEDLRKLVDRLKPSTIYTHSLADRHDTHVAVALTTIQATRQMPKPPPRVLGCEVWGDLDWLPDAVSLDVSGEDALAKDLIGVFVSQIDGGKDYVSATLGRRKAQATYAQSHQVDHATDVILAMDLTPLVLDPSASCTAFVEEKIREFSKRTSERITRLAGE